MADAALLSMLTRHGSITGRARSGAVDSQNLPTIGEAASTAVDYYMEQLSAEEVAAERDAEIGDSRLVLPPGVTVDGTDRFVGDDGITYEFIGPPARVFDAELGTEHHLECVVREATG